MTLDLEFDFSVDYLDRSDVLAYDDEILVDRSRSSCCAQSCSSGLARFVRNFSSRSAVASDLALIGVFPSATDDCLEGLLDRGRTLGGGCPLGLTFFPTR